MDILTEKELEILLKVETSVAFAQRIIERNTALLEYLNSLPSIKEEIDKDNVEIEYLGNFGCPHCKYSGSCQYFCKECVWKNINNDLEEEFGCNISLFTCCSVTFGGISLNFLKTNYFVELSYSADSEEIFGMIPDNNEELPQYFDELENCKTFVKGHIEWANEIIKRDGEKR